MDNVSDRELDIGLISWIIPLFGGIIGILVEKDSKYVKHWSYLSISFGILIIIVNTLYMIFFFLFSIFFPLIILLKIVMFGIYFLLIVIWLVGIIKEREKTYWKPPIIYELSEFLRLFD
jgi:uncharacterized membrane protein